MDVLLGALLVNGVDQFRSGKKLGKGYRQVGDLDVDELWDYMRPFAENVSRFPGVIGIVLHDGLPAAFLDRFASDRLRFEKVTPPAGHANYEARFYCFRDWLAGREDVTRAWLVDVNDVAFKVDPFAWLDDVPADRPAVGEEWTPYRGNEWFETSGKHLPVTVADLLLVEYGHRCPLNCGSWGGTRRVALDVLVQMCRNLDSLRAYLETNPPPFPIVTDMWAFGAALIHYPVTPFKMNAHTELDGVPSPLVHDRQPALDLARAHDDPIGPVRAALKHTQRLPGWCWDEKAEAMLRLVLETRPSVLVEIGVFGGRSLLAQALGLKQNGRGVIYGIDPWTRGPSLEGNQFGDEAQTAKACWTDATLAEVYSGLLAATVALGLSPHVRFLCAPSQLVAEAFEPGSIDVLHIDGNHCAEAAVRDVVNYLPRVRPRGWVWVDDTDWDSVRPALDLIAQTCQLVTDAGRWRLYRAGAN